MEPQQKRQKVEAGSESAVCRSDAAAPAAGADTQYLDSINPQHLNFDYDKVCLVTLSTVNVYCCLVCGVYLQGRAATLPACLHAVSRGHRVFINTDTLKVYILPDNVETTARARVLDDIRYQLAPTYTLPQDLCDSAADMHGVAYLPGYVGLNREGGLGFVNAVVQMVAHIEPIRDYYLFGAALARGTPRGAPLSAALGAVVRKVWLARLWRRQVSPHEFVQLCLQRRQFGDGATPRAFLVWLLNELHREAAPVGRTCRGTLEVATTPVLAAVDTAGKVQAVPHALQRRSQRRRFWVLALALPPLGVGADAVAQVALAQLLAKYDGVTVTQTADALHTYRLVAPLPPYMIFHVERNLETGAAQHNPTVVTFPLVLDMEAYVGGGGVYELVACVTHDAVGGGELDHARDAHEWPVRLRKTPTEWVEVRDLSVERCERELMFLDESYLLVWRRQNRANTP